MKIAVPTKNNVVDDHFGHCEYFTVFTIENNEVASSEKIDSQKTCGCKSEIVPMLKANGVNTMLVGNLGMGAINKITGAGMKLVRGCNGDVNVLIKEYLKGNIIDALTVCHEHGDGNGQCSH